MGLFKKYNPHIYNNTNIVLLFAHFLIRNVGNKNVQYICLDDDVSSIIRISTYSKRDKETCFIKLFLVEGFKNSTFSYLMYSREYHHFLKSDGST